MAEDHEVTRDKLVKNLKVSLRTHKEIAHASTDTGKAMYELVDEAWECWKQAAGTQGDIGSKHIIPAETTEAMVLPKDQKERNLRLEKLKDLGPKITEITRRAERDIAAEVRAVLEGKADIGSGRGSAPPRHRKRGNG